MDKIWSKYSYPDFRFARFRLGEDEFCIDIRNVKEMIRNRGVLKLDDAPSFLEGFVDLRGMQVPVVDLRKRFSLEAGSSDSARIIISSLEGRIVGLIVDEVRDISMGCKEVKINKRPASCKPWESCVDAVVETNGASVYVMDLMRLLSGAELKALDSPAA
jgi:purine-binding chemotaxis protein CheW